MTACLNGKSKGSKVALMLLQAGADATVVRADDEMTALKFAVKRSTPEVLQALIDAGAQVDGPRGTDQTALMIAARSNNVASLKVLVENRADVSLPCKLPWAEGRTAEDSRIGETARLGVFAAASEEIRLRDDIAVSAGRHKGRIVVRVEEPDDDR